MSDIILFGRTQDAAQTPFDNTSNGFTATDVQAAIEEAMTTAETTFSYTKIDVGETVTVPEGQEMVHASDLMVLGDLIVHGTTYQLPNPVDTGLSWSLIPSGVGVSVPVNRVLFYFSPLVVHGNLMVGGYLKEVS